MKIILLVRVMSLRSLHDPFFQIYIIDFCESEILFKNPERETGIEPSGIFPPIKTILKKSVTM